MHKPVIPKVMWGALAISLTLHLLWLFPNWYVGSLQSVAKGPGRLTISLRPAVTPSVNTAPYGSAKPGLERRIDAPPAAVSAQELSVTAGHLTSPPRLLDELPEVLTTGAESSHSAGGEITLRLLIGVNGRALHLTVLSSTLSRQLEEQVVATLFYARYAPGLIGTRAVNAEMTVTARIE